MKFPYLDSERLDSGGFLYGNPGVCIYCGDKGEPRTREHIVPFGLFGDLILADASCTACQHVTSRLESFVLQKMLGIHRRRLGFRSQNKKGRRKKIKAFVHRTEIDGSEIPIELDVDQFPIYSWSLPKYDTPGLLWPAPMRKPKRREEIVSVVSNIDAGNAIHIGGGDHPVSMPSQPYNRDLFTRFLAKVAHSYACATIGLDNFEPILNKFTIEGDRDQLQFVGGETEISPATGDLFELALGIMTSVLGQKFLSVRIRLLSYLGTPTYTVLVGRGFEHDISEFKNCAYAKPFKLSVVARDGSTIFSVG